MAEPQRRAALTLPQPREPRGAFLRARPPPGARTTPCEPPVRLGSRGGIRRRALRGAATGSSSGELTQQRHYSPLSSLSAIRVADARGPRRHHDAPGLRRSTCSGSRYRYPDDPASGEGFHRTLTDKRSRRTNDPGQSAVRFPSSSLFFLEGAPPGLAQHFPAERAQSSTFRLAGSAATVRV